MKKRLITIVAALILSVISYAQTNYYVSAQHGNDSLSGTSLSEAWRTITRAANSLQAGDTVFITSGIYYECVLPQYSGNANQYITYTVYPGDTAIIDGSDSIGPGLYLDFSDRGIFDVKNKKYINVIGLTIRNSGKGGGVMCRYGSSYINIENNHIYNCGATGIGAGYSRYEHPLATNIVAKGNVLERCSLQSRESLSFRSVIDFEISNNIIRDTPKEGIDAKSGCANGIICNNYVSNAKAVGIYIDAGYPDALYASSHNIHVYNNICDSCISSGIAVASEEGCLGEDIWIYNNIISNTIKGNGIIVADFGSSQLGGSLQDIYIINNTIYNSARYGIYVNNFNTHNIYIRNNISSQNAQGQIVIKEPQEGLYIDSIYIENNLIDGTNVNHGDFPVFGNPDFVNASAGDFHLLTTSPAIDNGTAINAPNVDFDDVKRPVGNGYDIGAYEYPHIIGLNNEDNISCYPNPTKGLFFVKGEDALSIQILNSNKQLIRQIEVNENVTPINLNDISKGIYFAKIVTTKGRILKKIIVQ